jgi:predicted transcriptional regulator
MTAHALAAERCPRDENQVIETLRELQLAGYVRLDNADDQQRTTTAYLVHA